MRLTIASAPEANAENSGVLFYSESYDTLRDKVLDVEEGDTGLEQAFQLFLESMCVNPAVLKRIYAKTENQQDNLLTILTETLEETYPNLLIMVDNDGNSGSDILCYVFDAPKVIVKLDGGLVQEMISEIPLEVLKLDYDVDGADEDELIKVDGEKCFAEVMNMEDGRVKLADKKKVALYKAVRAAAIEKLS